MVHPTVMRSPRLIYRRLEARSTDAFFDLAVDDHIKEYLLDGQTMTRDWVVDEIARSEALYRERDLPLWLVYLADATSPIGFCGFRIFDDLQPEPQILYALLQAYTGQGLATEIARALVAHAEAKGLDTTHAAVDAPNVASIRVLEKLGFVQCGEVPGAFGRTLLFKRPNPERDSFARS